MSMYELKIRSLLKPLSRGLSYVCGAALIFTGCGEDSSRIDPALYSANSISGTWALTERNGSLVAPSETAIMQISESPSALGCSGNILARPTGSQLSYQGVDRMPGCNIDFTEDVQVNRDAVTQALQTNPTVVLDSGHLVVDGLVFSPAN